MILASALAALLAAAPAARAASDSEPVRLALFDSPGGYSTLGEWLTSPFRKSQPGQPAAARGDATFKIVSWNLQTFGKGISSAKHKPRREGFLEAIGALFSDQEAKVLAAQEVANRAGASALSGMLPSPASWTQSFEVVPGAGGGVDAMQNGFWVRDGVEIECEAPLFGAGSDKSQHPARVAHMRHGDFDFTIITVHLSFEGGHADASGGELSHILDWLQAYYAKPGADPDVVIVGDFNLPSRAGKGQSERSGSAWHPVEDYMDQWRGGGKKLPDLVTLVDRPTSRSNGEAANNYDHFILSKRLAQGAYVEGSADRVSDELIASLKAIEASKTSNPKKPVRLSDHYPISARFRFSGIGGDGQPIRRDGAAICSL